MALISIILGLLLDRRWDELDQWRQFGWFSKFSKYVLEKTEPYLQNSSARFLAVIALPVLAVMFVQEITASWFMPVSFLFAFIVFVYCLGSLDIEQKLEQIISTLTENDQTNAKKQVQELSSEATIDDDNMLDVTMHSSMNIIIERLFGIIFWFTVLGPVGAILYRLSQQMLINYSDDPLLSKSCERMLYLLNWIPERFLVISFAITGHFEGALSAYRENKDTDRTQQFLLIDVCHGALHGNDNDDKASYLTAFRGLLLRSLIFWLASIAVLTLLGWN